MEFFQIKNALRKIGKDKYIIGQQPFDPLVLIEGKKLSTKQIDVDQLNFKSGFLQNLSGEKINIIDLLQNSTGFNLSSGNPGVTELHLHEHIDALSGNLETTELHLHEHIDTLSGNLDSTGLSLLNEINELQSTVSGIEISGVGGSGLSSGFEEEMLRSRFLQKEAFELNEFGEVTPTTHEFISDTMWILRDDNNLELRANLWRYDTGPNAFTDDISF
tara:strand:- start:69 stop:722 length:654 start_codon:yes stop_codon:yes gene_type:complete